jgi:hypothetical protein
VSRYASLAIPVTLVIVVAIVAVALARDGDDDGGSRSGAGPDATSSSPPADVQAAPEPQAGPGSDAKLNRVIARIQAAALEEAPDVAAPIISRSESAGRITAAEAERLRRAARALARGQSPQQLAGTVDFSDPGVGAVVRQALAALTRRAQKIAKPILARALDRGDITRSEAADVRSFVESGGGYTLP